MALFKSNLICLVLLTVLSGCASVPTVSETESQKIKEFREPQEGVAGLYVYRDSFLGKGLKKDIWVDGKCLGESAPDVFFFVELPAGTHQIATESEFSPNIMNLIMKGGQNYFVRQYIKMGMLVGGANLEQVDDMTGREAISKLKMAQIGSCSKPNP